MSYLALEYSDLGGVFSFAFAVMWRTSSDKNQTFEIFGVFKQKSKISGIPSLHLFIDETGQAFTILFLYY